MCRGLFVSSEVDMSITSYHAYLLIFPFVVQIGDSTNGS